MENNKNEKALKIEDPVYQSRSIIALACLTQSLIRQLKDSDESGIQKKDIEIEFDSVNICLDGRAQLVLFYIIQKFTKKVSQGASKEIISNNKAVTLDVKEVAQIFKLKERQTRDLLVCAVDTLYQIDLRWMEKHFDKKSGNEELKRFRLRILQEIDETVSGKYIKNNKLTVHLTDKLANYLPTTNPMPFPKSLYAMRLQYHPSSLAFAITMLWNSYLNYDKGLRKKRISVMTLLYNTHELPAYDTILKRGEIKRKIIIPFMRDINHLKEIGFLENWNFYSKATGKFKLDGTERIKYDDFKLWSIDYNISGLNDKSTICAS